MNVMELIPEGDVETPAARSERLLKLKQVEEKVGLGKSTIYRKMEKHTFPMPRRVDANSVRWRESDIDRWIAQLPIAEDPPSQ